MELEKLSTAPSHEAGAECRIKANGEETDVFITIQGQDSKAYRKAKKRQMREFIEARKNEIDIDDLDTDRMDVELLADCTLGWRGITVNGEEYEFSRDNAVKLYTDAPEVARQLLQFIEDRAVFTNG
jgi:hypothetical protein